MKYFDINLSELVEIYNHVPQVLSRKATKVSVTETSLITKSNQPLFLANAKNGNYWVIATEDKTYWLLPKGNLRIDTFKYESVKSLFQCDGYQPETASQFTLLQPAKVSLTPSGTEWKLEELGRLDFSTTPLPELESEQEWAFEERNQLQSQLEQLLSQMQKQLNDKFTTIETELKEIKQRLSPNCHDNLLNNDIKLVENVTLDLPTNQNTQSSSQSKSLPKLTPITQPPQTSTDQYQAASGRENNFFQAEILVADYNKAPFVLAESAIKVSENKDSLNQRLLLGSNQPPIFEKNNYGSYWIFTRGDKNYLVPSPHIKIDKILLKIIQSLFECRESKLEKSTSEFFLVKPAIVSLVTKETWQLIELGIIQFN